MARRVVERATELPGPPDAVWHALMTPEVVPVIDPSVHEWRPDRAPVCVGTRFTIRGRLGPVPFRATTEVTCWEPGVRAVFATVRPARPLRMVATHELAAAGSGTRHRWTIEITGPAPLVAGSARLWRGGMEKQAIALRAYLLDGVRLPPRQRGAGRVDNAGGRSGERTD